MGLYENAFDAYRELRDALKRDQRESWIRVSIRMANTLYQMDSLSEARYLLRDLKIKDSVSAYVLVFTHILLGELEENFGAPEYALRNYETAFARLSDADDETLSMRLFALMKKHFLERDERQRYLQLLHDSIAILPAGSAQQTGLRLEYLKLHIRPESIEAALQMALTMLRSGHPLSAAHYLQVRLYLADIYGYLGKWHLSRSCLRSLLANDILLPDALTRVAIMLNIGVVEKELGMYGSAMECLQEALELSRTERLLRQQYVIKAHLGHIYQLVYSYMRAHEYLTDTLAWAEEHRDDELLVRASLFLSAYELQHDRDDRARQYLERAAAALQLQNAPIDQLNLTYYQIVYALHQHDVESAAAQLERLSEAAHTIHKFDLLARWLNGRLQQETGQPEVARGALETALHLSRRYRLPQLEFQILRDLIDLSRQAAWWDDFNAFVSEAHAVHARLMRAVGDPILERQMKESKDYEAFIKATAR